ncbi:helix-hairpin-helix domain-containing protein [Acidipropionibacterium thoenii]|uniref:helix-hairpin-helix domain-containing protein n=1 Tax=Acidipropionibacterium thoenii TaxID=1751 RepID=UPI000414DB90|nr:helix-hairpin-helix domain-containing protein [Acidipropionibacterium thoenii]
MNSDDSYRERLETLLAGLPTPAAGPRRADREGADQEEAGHSDPPARTTTRTFGAPHLSALGIVLVLVLAVVAVWLMRSKATSVPLSAVSVAPANSVAPAAPPAAGSADPSAGPDSAGPSSAAQIRVHVAGRVRHPGVYALAAGARVDDALRAAGGVATGARTGALNLAAPVCDGCQVLIAGTGDGRLIAPEGAAPDSAAPAAGSGSPAGAQRIDLNTATSEELQTLDGVGPATAAKIIAWRTQHGRFSDVSELQEVDGIGPKTFARLKDHVRV